MSDARVAGVILLVLGAITFFEARRLVELRTEMLAGAVVGDDTFPLIVALGLLLLGAYLLLNPPGVGLPPSFPGGPVRSQMIWSAAALVAYCALVPSLGYTAGTVLGATALFKAMGRYRMVTSLALGVLATAALSLLFRGWLRHPLPSGMLGP